jgi:hypothetical protein
MGAVTRVHAISKIRQNAITCLNHLIESIEETQPYFQDAFLAQDANEWLNQLGLDTSYTKLEDLKQMLEDLQPHNNVAVVTWNDSKINRTFEFISLEEMDEQEFENWIKWFVGSDGTYHIH